METSIDTKTTEGQEKEKKPNEIVSLLGDERTTIVFSGNDITISTVKIDSKKNTEKPKGDPITIARSAIASVKWQRHFSPLPILAMAGVGAGIGFIFIGGFITVLICAALGCTMAFPKRMEMIRKDGTKFKIELTLEAYEKLIKILF